MVKVKNSLLTKILSFILVLTIMFGMVPPAVIASAATDSMATIEALVNGATMEDSNTVMFADTELVWSEKNTSIGRNSDGWWVGIKVTAPEGMNAEALKDAKYQSNQGGIWSDDKSFWSHKDSSDDATEHYIELWVLVNEQYLNDAILKDKTVNYEYRFSWDGDSDFEQKITMKIDPETVVLKKYDKTVYPSSSNADIQVITDGVEIKNNKTNIVIAELKNDIELTWTAADSVRPADGWWVGIDVVAPEDADLANAKYQNQTSDGWSVAKDFNTYKDTENSVQLWGTLNEAYLTDAIKNNKTVNYSWRFDWDGDDVYEQFVELKLDPEKVTLNDEDGNQVYPCWGTVTPLTGGNVTGGTSELTLLLEEASLEYSSADASTGKDMNGWYVGMRVNAPEGYSEDTLKNATYDSSIASPFFAAVETTEDVSFWSEKSSEDGAEQHYVEIWIWLDTIHFETYDGENIENSFAFDWDGDGENDQTINYNIFASENIVLNKREQTNFGFADSSPEVWVGEGTYNGNTLTVDSNDKNDVTYSIQGTAATIDAVTGEVTLLEAGTVVITATHGGDTTYNAATASYTLTITKKQQEGFVINQPSAKEFAEGETFTNTASGGQGSGAVVYEIVASESLEGEVLENDKVATIDSATGTVTFLRSGKVTVKALKAEDDLYYEAFDEYTLTIERGTQEITFEKGENPSATYGEAFSNVATGSSNISYTSSDESIAKVNNDGSLVMYKAGAVTITATAEQNEKHNSASKSYTVTINKAEQSKVYFEYENPETVAYNDNNNEFSNKLLGGSGNGEVTYEITEGFDVAEISSDGTLSVKKAGTITVIATKAGDDCYKQASEYYTLKVEPDTPEFNVEDVTLTYGTTEYQIVPESINTSGAPYEYSIIGENTIGASVDANGKLTFADSTDKVGSVTVQVLHKETEQYATLAKTMTVNVEYLTVKDKCTADGEKKNTSGWFTGAVTITAPDGYTLGYSNDLSADEWSETITINTLADMDKKVYLKNADGYMTGAVDLSFIKLDIDAPSELSVTFEESFIKKLINTVTFGIFEANNITVIISAYDDASGVDYFEYSIGGEYIKVPSYKIEKVDGTYKYTFKIYKEIKEKISIRAVDVAGNVSEYADGITYVVDNTTPILEVKYAYSSGSSTTVGKTIYTSGDVNLTFTIKEANFLLSDNPIITINGSNAEVEWAFDETTGKATANVKLSGHGEYDVAFDYADASGNYAKQYEVKFCIDTARPVITVDYKDKAVKENIFNAERIATITVEEQYFNAEEFAIEVVAEDIFENAVQVDDYSVFLKDANNWKAIGDNKYVAEIRFGVNAVYKVTYSYKEKASNTETKLKDNFTVDTTTPADLKIELSEPVFAEKLLEAVTFGYYQAEVEVNISATDTTTGVDYFKLYYTKDGTSTTNKDSFVTKDKELRAVQDTNDKSLYTATYKLPAQARGTIYVEAYDNATNMDTCYENQVIVVDDITPELNAEYTFVDGKYNEFNDIYYTQGETKVEFTITEANFDRAEAPVITVNNVEQSVEWTNTNGTDDWVGEITLSGNDDYVVRATFADRSGNVMADYEKEIRIDGNAPEITVKYENGTPYQEKDGIKYYPTTQTATITVVEHNFRAEDVEVDVTATDINSNELDVQDYAIKSWTSDGDIHTATIEYSSDAIYTFDIAYTDLAGNVYDEYVKDNFVVDTKKATGLKIEYNQSIVDVVLGALTFGVYKENATVTVSADDITAGVEFFELTYTKENGSSDINTDTYTVKLPAVADENDAGKFTASHTIPAQARGNISVTAFDKAGNKISTNDEKVIVVDDKVPTISVEYEFTDNHVVESENIFYTKDTTEVTFTIDEANFDLANKPVVTVNGEEQQVEWSKTENTDLWVADITLTGNGNYIVNVTFVDASTNEMEAYEQEVRIDNEVPVIGAVYDFTDDQYREFNNIYYTQGETEVTFTINESNFLESEAPVITVNGVEQSIEWTNTNGTNDWVGKITLSGNGDYVVKATFTDRSQNVMETYEKEVHIDDVLPEITVEYNNNDARNENNYKADRTATITVVEHNFRSEELVVDVTATDINGNIVDVQDYAAYLKNSDNWTEVSEDTYEAKITYSTDAIYTFDISYTDLAENIAVDYEIDNFVVDHEAAQNVKIEYSTSLPEKVKEILSFGYYQPDVIVTVTATDITAGVEDFVITYTQEAGTSTINTPTYTTEELTAVQDENDKSVFTATHTIPAQARGSVSVVVTDNAGNESGAADDKILVVDNIAPDREVIFTPERILDGETLIDVYSFAENDNVILYYAEKAVVTFKVNEANFYAEDVIISVNNECVDPASITWSQDGDVWTGSIEITGDGDYVVTMNYVDRSSNMMTEYKSPKLAIDNTAPVITVEYDNNDARNENNYKEDRTATITVVEHNFRADDILATVTAHDINGNVINVEDYAAYLSDRASWTEVEKDTYVAEITYSTDAIYTFDIGYTDLIGNEAADYETEEFVVDHDAAQNITIEYSTSLLEKVIEAITFGFYKPEVIVTITANDVTAGVEDFVITYTQQDGTSTTNTATYTTDELAPVQDEDDKSIFTVTYTIPAQARGTVSVDVMDNAGNESGKADNKVLVVDNVAPVIDITYETVDDDTLVQFIDAENDYTTKGTFAQATTAYYNGDVVAKININEANFFEGANSDTGIVHEVGIKLTKTDDEGNTTVFEFLPEGAEQKYADAEAKYITWNTVGDNHSIEIPYTDNADYVLEVEYTDYSTNDAEISANDGNESVKTYTSKTVTVDKLAPVVTVEYDNQNVIHTIDGRDYLDATQSATITVEEHNFRADDFVATVIAQNIIGEDVEVENFAQTLSTDENWTKNGNVYTITINYPVDANYTFDYEFKDLAQNTAEEYEADEFTVDTTAPEELTVSYSTSVFNEILESVTFGYYNAQMTVTITADDETAGVYYFVYSYLKSEGVSDVNAELIDELIEDANENIKHDGKTSTASFTIPKLLLVNDNQFNGTVEFTAYDKSENNTEMIDDERIVVDNIKPTGNITYNEPVQNANNISYYAGNIDATIVINEANFHSEDVVVTVTKDGNNYPVQVQWTDNNVDVHTGTFTLTEDGDYIVKVQYMDRSTNIMEEYTSNRLTIDTKAPTVNVSNIKYNSANKDEKYGFTITADDINMDASSIKPELTSVIRNDDGTFTTQKVSLGQMKTVEAGKTYSFTVDNLKADGIYSLVCTLKDMSGNAYSKLTLSDGKEYEQVKFSINRDGSTFAASDYTMSTVEKYYVYSIVENIVLEEVNVDPIENYVVYLNGKVLTEGTDYETKLISGSGQWSKRTYTISKELFKSEGEYSIIIESIDKAETTAYSDVKNLNVSFVVDQTAPVLTISGLETKGKYQVEEQTVTLIPTDDGGRLNSLKVVLLDSKGNPLKNEKGEDISVRFDMSGEEFLAYLNENDGIVTFTIPEGLEHQVRIICNDCATNVEGNTNEYNELFELVTVSPNWWVIFFATKPLFYGSIAGVVLLTALICFIIAKKRKKDKEAK